MSNFSKINKLKRNMKKLNNVESSVEFLKCCVNNSLKFMFAILVIIFFNGNDFCFGKCFEKRLDCQLADKCCCDGPSRQAAFKNTPSIQAFLSCSWMCSNNEQCLAFNFNNVSATCDLFFNSLNCFQFIIGCVHLQSTSPRVLTVNADDQIDSLYLDGVPQERMPNWDFYYSDDWISIPFNVKVIAVRVSNFAGAGSFEAYSDDGFIRTDTTWKCFPTTPALDSNNNNWYDVHYDDSNWLPAINQEPGYQFKGALKIWSRNFLLAYCRKFFCI
ncbi:hypothetical protein HELRODRAFT_174040 [Helobdella robusta]|uniref:Apple domain-containing protein n=1 Tax=Helobdella robusta TaxID=6412 RepID=T1F7I5_HELRO|nr:hypothetical protein HELRODRAFT_174040 [Helobdella robusta]ESO03147.1 hypothetical protein HELRODRAFT_174040 [Helobdella robusta]